MLSKQEECKLQFQKNVVHRIPVKKGKIKHRGRQKVDDSEWTLPDHYKPVTTRLSSRDSAPTQRNPQGKKWVRTTKWVTT